ncbi:hypothetical protein VTL71DRAFT_12671 [Oculimacula yallundae]|uniref:4-hydroxybenzoate polyprenyltransferase, mitochondrial n=1 Tax=Oculimacula yallundae TaxID=86028 RepID=A0ABR4CPY8_9HELO
MSFIKSTSRNAMFRLPSGCRSSVIRTALRSQREHMSLTLACRETLATYGHATDRHEKCLSLQRRHLHQSHGRSLVAAAQTPSSLSPKLEPQILPAYEAPKTGLLSVLPSSWVPYAELIRLDKPAGTYYLFVPCLFSTLLAAPLAMPIASPLSVLGTSLLFFGGALIMRGAGCTINDLWDRNLDPHVRRTRLRPIARGAVTPFSALAFTGVQLFTGLAILLQFPTQCLFYGVPSLLLVAAYPLAKRVTHYPQFVLGLTFSWGAIMGFPALGVDLLQDSAALTAAGFLYASNIAWTVLYDMIYAHMDIKDDAKAGIKSIALRHDAQTKQILSGLAVAQIGLLAAAGVAAGAGPVFFVGSCGGAAVTLAVMIKKVNLKSVKDCWWWFVNGCWITGGVISAGLGGDYIIQFSKMRMTLQCRVPLNFHIVAWWKKDTALNTYIFSLFLIGLPFTLFGTYVIYQLQVIGYMIGADSNGLPCITYCLVPFGSRKLDLNSIILYLNAFGFGLGGIGAVLIAAYADFWERKSTLVAVFIVLYGIVCIPVYWLRDTSLAAFNTLCALYVVYAVITYTLSVVLCIFIPHCMRTAGEKTALSTPNSDQTFNYDTKTPHNVTATLEGGTSSSKASVSRKYGFMMSIFGAFGTAIGGILALLVVIILTETLPTSSGQSAGLLVTTIVGFITIIGAVVSYFGLPAVPAKPKANWKAWWFELFTPLQDLSKRKNMAVLLLSYTIYVDTVFALSSVTGQLYYAQVLPDTLEFSLYSMTGTIFGAITTLVFYGLQSWRPPFKLEHWLIIGYALILIIPIWGCIGFADNVNFGFKNRWEFYAQSLLFNISGSIVNNVFRVLFSEMVPKGSEVEWFGLQVILSCATAWVSYVANAPLQNATHELRFPLVLCLIMLVVPVVLEICRCYMGVFAKDKHSWKEHDESVTSSSSA